MGAFRRVKTALIGSGAISGSYLANIQEKFHVLELVGCSDLQPERAAARAEQFGIRALTNEEIWADPSIEIVLNTTWPLAHHEVSRTALLAGKHVYTEKMLAVGWEEGRQLVELARQKGLLFTAAPDTFLGGGWQTARNIVDSGWLGEVVAAYGVCVRGYKDNGDTPADPKPFVFSPGGGIPFDMGGYYLHNLINLLGSIRRVCGFAKTHAPRKPYGNPRHPQYGKDYTADSPNTMAAALEFESGVLANLTLTSEAQVWAQPRFELHGTQGSLVLFDPNDFGGRVRLRRNIQADWAEMPSLYPYVTDSRGIGAADMAYALLNGRTPRADAALGLHAFEAVHKVMQSSESGRVMELETRCARPAPLPLSERDGVAYESILDN